MDKLIIRIKQFLCEHQWYLIDGKSICCKCEKMNRSSLPISDERREIIIKKCRELVKGNVI